VRRLPATLGSLLFLGVAPGTVAGLIPWWVSGWSFGPPLFGSASTRIVGLLGIALGVFVLLDSFLRFVLDGLGTPAPIAPPETLVVTGWYRFVRNPMYVAILALVFGQAVFFASPGVFAYGCVVWICVHAFVVMHEEPTLRQKFGATYDTYCVHVGRWWPHLRSYRG
jgi:protein-S-isoprenylcysteine O-methyltransferase Ste14